MSWATQGSVEELACQERGWVAEKMALRGDAEPWSADKPGNGRAGSGWILQGPRARLLGAGTGSAPSMLRVAAGFIPAVPDLL